MKTLKSKLTSIYILLVIIIAVVSAFSILNLYNLKKSIDHLIVNNYKSINASRQMQETVEAQNELLLNYIYADTTIDLNDYNSKTGTFYKWFNIEYNNITESGEDTFVNKIKSNYLSFQNALPAIQILKDKRGTSYALKYYIKTYHNYYTNITYSLKSITLINETAMFKNKTNVTKSAKDSMYILILISIIAILTGFIIASYFTDKFIKPLYTLKRNMMEIKEGQIHKVVDINSNDEIGALADEFNHMVTRLELFEKSTKGKLLEEKNKSLAIVKSISDPLIVLDTNFKAILMNNACEHFFSINETDAINKHFLEIICNGDIFDYIVKAYNSKTDKYIPNIISVNKDDKEFYFDTIVTKVHDEGNKVKGMVVLFQNITKLKKLDNVKTEFVYMVSHEFKTPLTSIMMGTSLIKEEAIGKLSDKQLELIETIESDTEQLNLLVSNIIKLSKLESEHDMFYFEKTSIYSILENCVKLFNEQAIDKKITIALNAEDDLPYITADTEKLSWVINNLLSNAIKYTEVNGNVSITARQEDHNLLIEVKDNGKGISNEYTDKVFDKFFRIDDTSYDIPGSGLGLTIAHEIIEAHKGKIWCESTVGKGSCFCFTLPL